MPGIYDLTFGLDDPVQRQAAQAEMLRQRPMMDFQAKQQQFAQQDDQARMLALAAALGNNQEAAKSVSSYAEARAKARAPKVQEWGAYSPDSGEFIENPVHARDQQEQRALRRAVADQTYGLNQARLEQQAGIAAQTDATRRAVADQTDAYRRDAMAQRAQDAAAMREIRMQIAQLAAGGRNQNADLQRQLLEQRLEAYQRKADDAAAGKPLLAPEQTKLHDMTQNAQQIEGLSASFKDEYAKQAGGLGPLEKATGLAANIAGGTGMVPKGWVESEAWWNNYQRYIDLPARHQLFGATLTNNEQAAWESATVHRGMSPDVIKQKLAEQNTIMQTALERNARSLVVGGRNAGQIEELTGGRVKNLRPDKRPPQLPGQTQTADDAAPHRNTTEAPGGAMPGSKPSKPNVGAATEPTQKRRRVYNPDTDTFE